MFDPAVIIKTVGYLGLFGIIFAESGLLIGFFLPGDSLLFSAGFLASQGFGNIGALILITSGAAILGDSAGYAFGYRIGPRLFGRKGSRLFRPEYLLRARLFYRTHGKKTIILARFMPAVRTFAPIVAGAGQMHYATFLYYNVIGGLLWAAGLTSLGYTLGSTIPNIDGYILPIIAGIIFLSILPPLIHWSLNWSHQQKTDVNHG